MVSTTEGFTYNSPRSPMNPQTLKKPSASKSLCIFTNILNAKNITAICRVGASKSNHKSNKAGTMPWALKPKRNVN